MKENSKKEAWIPLTEVATEIEFPFSLRTALQAERNPTPKEIANTSQSCELDHISGDPVMETE